HAYHGAEDQRGQPALDDARRFGHGGGTGDVQPPGHQSVWRATRDIGQEKRPASIGVKSVKRAQQRRGGGGIECRSRGNRINVAAIGSPMSASLDIRRLIAGLSLIEMEINRLAGLIVEGNAETAVTVPKST